MDKKKISVIIPFKKPAPFLEETLQSLTSQTINSDLDIILVEDDGSGVSATRNRGLMRVKGGYIYFIDSDDVLINNRVLEKARDILAKHQRIDFIYGNLIKGDEKLRTIGSHITPYFHGKYLKQYFCRGGAILLQTMLFRNNNGRVYFDQTYNYSEDLDYILRRTYLKKGMHVNMYFIVHREHTNSLSYKNEPGKARSIIKTLDIFVSFFESHPEISCSKKLYNRIMAVQSIIIVHMLHRYSYRKDALILLLKSLKYFPFCITKRFFRVIGEFFIPVPIARKIRQSLVGFKIKSAQRTG